MKMSPHLRPLLLACLAAFSPIQAQQPAGTQAEPTPEQQAEILKKIEERRVLVDSFGWSMEGSGKLGAHAEIGRASCRERV
jgi:hypothetical protein